MQGNPEDVVTVATITGVHSGIPLSYEPSVLGVIPPGPQAPTQPLPQAQAQAVVRIGFYTREGAYCIAYHTIPY